MYKKANRFMIGSRKGWGYSERSKASEPKAATKVRKKTLAIAREYQKIMAKKKAHELRVSKEQQCVIAEKEAGAVLREAIIASANERKRSRLEAESKKVGTRKVEQATSKRSATKKEIAVLRKQDGRLTKLRTGLVEQKTKPVADIVKALIDYKFVPSGKHLQIEPHWAGRHPKQAIDRAKASLERYAKSQYDEIRIFSTKYMGRVYFHVAGMQQMIDWQPAKAPRRNSHGGEVRARGINSSARLGISFKD